MEFYTDEILPLNATLVKSSSFDSFDGIRYSIFVLFYLCVRDLIKYAVPLLKHYIQEKLRVD